MIASNTQRLTGRRFEHLNFGSASVKGFGQIGVPMRRLEGAPFHNPKIIPTRARRIDLNDDLGPAVAIDVANADRSTGVRQARAVEIGAQRMTPDRRQVLPDWELHPNGAVASQHGADNINRYAVRRK